MNTLPGKMRGLLLAAVVAVLCLTWPTPPSMAGEAEWQGLLQCADSLFRALQIDSAIATAHQALAGILAERGELDTNAAATYHRIGLYYSRGNYDSCEAYSRRALALWDRLPQASPVSVARSLNNLAIVVQRDGRLGESEAMNKRALALKQSALPRYHNEIAKSYYNLSTLCITNGRYVDAEAYLREAKEIWDHLPGQDGSAYYLNLAVILNHQFRLEESIDASETMIGLTRQSGNGEAYYLATGNLADSYLGMGRWDAADSIMRETLSFCDTISGSHRNIVYQRVTTRVDRARLQRQMGNYVAAADLLDEADSLAPSVLPSGHYDRPGILVERGRLHFDMGQYDLAEQQLRDALTLGVKLFGPTSQRLVATYRMLAQTALALGQPDSALQYAETGVAIAYDNLPALTAAIPEDKAVEFALEAEKSLACYLEAVREPPTPTGDLLNRAMNWVARAKGVAIDLAIQRRRDQTAALDTETALLREKRRFAAEQLARAVLPTQTDTSGIMTTATLDSLRRIYLTACAAVARQESGRSGIQELPNVTVEQISADLRPDEAALEFYQVVSPGRPRESAYCAIAVDHQGARLRWLPGAAVDSLAAEYRRHLDRIAAQEHWPTEGDATEYRAIAAGLYAAVLAPFAEVLADKTTLYISPSGALHTVAFGGLCDRSGRYLTDGARIVMLDVVRELVEPEPDPPGGRGLLAMGAPDFTGVDAEYAAASDVGSHAARGSLLTRAACLSALDSLMPPLPGTEREIMAISSSATSSEFAPLMIHLGAQAGEAQFKSESRGRRYLHLATHGFSLIGDACGPSAQPTARISDPLLSSGLFLSGAQRALRDPAAVRDEDGVLYALEVAQLDLEGVEVVMLSACESGLGTQRGGEGLYGLRRAFALAGAQSVVATLWRLPDDAAAQLAPLIYTHLGGGLAEAVHHAQQDYRQSLRAAGRVDHPLLWAAFVPYGRHAISVDAPHR